MQCKKRSYNLSINEIKCMENMIGLLYYQDNKVKMLSLQYKGAFFTHSYGIRMVDTE